MKYIEVGNAIKSAWMVLEGMGYREKENPQLSFVVRAVFESAPEEDLIPREHGVWRYRGDCHLECSECGFHYPMPVRDYCPHCGAKMEEENDSVLATP